MPAQKAQVAALAPRIELTQVMDDVTVKKWRATPPRLESIKRVLRPPFVATVQGEPIMLGLTNECPADKLFSMFERVTYGKSDRSGGMVTRSRTFGFNPRNAVRRDYCASSALHRDEPEVWAMLQKCAGLVAKTYARELPKHYEAHNNAVEGVLDSWRMKGTPFTSGIINQSAALPYHRDSGNFPGVWSAMLVVRKQIEGAELVLPELDIAVDMPHGGLLLFDGQRWLHGVAPITRTHPEGRRYSCVFYSLHQLWRCLTPAEELRRYRVVKTQKEQGRV